MKNVTLKISLFLLLASSFVINAQVKKAAAAKAPLKASKMITKPSSSKADDGLFAEIETTKGKITLALEYKKTPITVASFVSLAEGTNTIVKAELKGKPFYDGLKFHRVIKDFMIQGGDPLGNGSGDPGYKFKDEIVTELVHDKGGILSMANSGPATNGSQFFITHKDTKWLNGKHTVFGRSVSGMDVINAIVQDDKIVKIKIIRNGADAKKFDAAKVFAEYYATKGDDDKKQAALEAAKANAMNASQMAAKKEYLEKFGTVVAENAASLVKRKAIATKTASGLEYVIIKGTGTKPTEGTEVFVKYTGFLEDGTLFQSNYEDVEKRFGKYNASNPYEPFPFKAGSKTGLIPGFLEGLELLSFGDKITLFIPSNLANGERGAGALIPPNSNIIFELEILSAMPEKK